MMGSDEVRQQPNRLWSRQCVSLVNIGNLTGVVRVGGTKPSNCGAERPRRMVSTPWIVRREKIGEFGGVGPSIPELDQVDSARGELGACRGAPFAVATACPRGYVLDRGAR